MELLREYVSIFLIFLYNILNISQTIVEGYFNMMMIVDFTNCTKEIAVVVNEMEELGKDNWRRYPLPAGRYL